MAIVYFFRVLFNGLMQMGRYFYSATHKFLQRLPFWERLNLLFVFICLILLLQAWRGYDITLNEGETFFHPIYSDDFLLFVIFFALSLLPVLFFFADYYTQDKLKNIALGLRLGGLGICFILYMLNVISPDRVAPTTEANFTWQFIIFGIVLTVNVLVGYMGIKLMPSTRLRSE